MQCRRVVQVAPKRPLDADIKCSEQRPRVMGASGEPLVNYSGFCACHKGRLFRSRLVYLLSQPKPAA
jgi:hypothetical protein